MKRWQKKGKFGGQKKRKGTESRWWRSKENPGGEKCPREGGIQKKKRERLLEIISSMSPFVPSGFHKKGVSFGGILQKKNVANKIK